MSGIHDERDRGDQRAPARLGSETDLEADLDRWDDLFDTLHAVDPAAASPPAPAPPSTPDAVVAELLDYGDGELEFTGDAEALGAMLGPSSLPGPRTDFEDDPTPLPAPRAAPRESVWPGPPRSLADAPTDDEIFGDLPDEIPDAKASSGYRRHGDNPDATRVADPDALLLAEVARPSAAEGRSQGAAIVRREDLERRRAEAEAEAEAAPLVPAGATRIAPGQILRGMAERAALALAEHRAQQRAGDAEAFAEVVDDFYGEIEIGVDDDPPVDGGPDMLPPPASLSFDDVDRAAETSPVARGAVGRRLNVNIARRKATAPPSFNAAERRNARADRSSGLVELDLDPDDGGSRPGLWPTSPFDGSVADDPEAAQDALDGDLITRDVVQQVGETTWPPADEADSAPWLPGETDAAAELEFSLPSETSQSAAIGGAELDFEAPIADPVFDDADELFPLGPAGAALAPRGHEAPVVDPSRLRRDFAMLDPVQDPAPIDEFDRGASQANAHAAGAPAYDAPRDPASRVLADIGEGLDELDVLDPWSAEAAPSEPLEVGDSSVMESVAADDFELGVALAFDDGADAWEAAPSEPLEVGDSSVMESVAVELPDDAYAPASALGAPAREAPAAPAVASALARDTRPSTPGEYFDQAVSRTAVTDSDHILTQAFDASVSTAVGEVDAAVMEQARARSEPKVAVRGAAFAVPEVDTPPPLPDALFADVLPALDLTRLELPEDGEPGAGLEPEAAMLLAELYERELGRLDDPRAVAALRCEAARVAELAGDVDRALFHLEAAAELAPDSYMAAAGLRRAAVAAGRWDELLPALDREIELAAPPVADALRGWRLQLLCAANEHELAHEALAAPGVAGTVRGLLAACELAAAEGRQDDLLASLDALSEVDGLEGPVELAHGHAATWREDPAAVGLYRRALRRDPTSRAPIWGLERLALRERRAADAAAAGERLLATGLVDLDPSLAAAVARRRALYAQDMGHDGAAADALGLAARLAPDDADVLRELAAALEAIGDRDSAARALLAAASVAASELDRAEALRGAARLLAAIGSPARERVEALHRLLAIDPDDTEALAALENACAEQGDLDALIELDRRAASADPDGGLFERVRIAKRLVAAGRTDEAQRELEAAWQLAPAAPVVADTLVRILGLAGRTKQRAQVLAHLAAIEADHRDPEIAQSRAAQAAEDLAYELMTAGSALSAAGPEALGRAAQAWRRVLDFDPESHGAHSALVRLAELGDDPRRVIDALAGAQAAARHPARAVGIAMRRAALLLAGDEPDVAAAEEALRATRALAPGEPRAVVQIAVLAAREQRWTDAALVLEERAVALGETVEATALRFRAAAILCELTPEVSQATSLLTRVVAAEPGFEPAAALLEAAHRKLGDASLLAADLDRKLRDGGGGSAEIFAQLVREAELLAYQVGDASRAVGLYEKALELRPGDPLARAGFVRACEAAGDAGRLAQLALDDLRAADDDDVQAKADAYEELARIDGELRGDAASALFSLESAARVASGRWSVLRGLERVYAADGRGAELAQVYGWQAASAAPADAASLWLAQARALERQDAPRRDILRAYRGAFEVGRGCRTALFALEAYAAESGPSRELAALEQAVARYFEHDARAQAAFATRAGETLHELGDVDAAIECFRAAAEASPDYEAAVVGWRRAALRGQLWLEVAEATQRHAAIASSGADRARLHHIVGIALMDKAVAGGRAVAALRRSLAFEPAALDPYLRLRSLFEEQALHADLVALLEQRLTVEPDPRHAIELHMTCAQTLLRYLDRPDDARGHLRAVLAREPQHAAALAQLAELAWEQQSWDEAAAALTAQIRTPLAPLARLETYARLGRLFRRHVPNRARAIEAYERVLEVDAGHEEALDALSLLCAEAGDFRRALSACERLLARRDRAGDSKIDVLHRVADILDRGLGERHRAERAYRAALDVDPTSSRALDALVEFFSSAGDSRSLRIHLDTVASAMRKRLAHMPLDPMAYRAMARALSAREQAGAAGSLAAAIAAAELAALLGETDPRELELAARASGAASSVEGLGDPANDELLLHRDVPSGLRQLLGAIDGRLAKATAGDLAALDAGSAERLDRSGSAEAAIVAEVARQLEAGDLEVYVTRRAPFAMVADAAGPLRIYLGARWIDAERPGRLRFAAARAIKLGTSHLSVLARRDAASAGALLVALLRSFRPDLAPGGVDLGLVATEQQNVRKVIPGGLLQELGPYAVGIAGADFDYQRTWDALVHTGNRVGLLAAGSVRAALEVVLLERGHRDLSSAASDPHVLELLRFAVSEDHVALRRGLATAE